MASCLLLLFCEGSISERTARVTLGIDQAAPVLLNSTSPLVFSNAASAVVFFIIFLQTTAGYVSFGLRIDSYIHTRLPSAFLGPFKLPSRGREALQLFSENDFQESLASIVNPRHSISLLSNRPFRLGWDCNFSTTYILTSVIFELADRPVSTHQLRVISIRVPRHWALPMLIRSSVRSTTLQPWVW